MIPDLVEQLPNNERLEGLTDDGAYDTKQVFESVIEHEATPIISPRKNAGIRKGNAFVHRNAAMAVNMTCAQGNERFGVTPTGEVWWKAK